jgi:hypothetical protein
VLARKNSLFFGHEQAARNFSVLYWLVQMDDVVPRLPALLAALTVHAPHAEQTRSRCLAHEQVLMLHDTTVLKLNGEREGLGRIHQAGGAKDSRDA